MTRRGFIHNSLDIKLLILYLMARVVTPIDFSILTELAMCDDGVDYFQLAQATAELVDTEHLLFTDGLYTITEKGRRNSAATESSLPAPIRLRCENALTKLNATLRRDAQVRAEVVPAGADTFRLRLALDDNHENLLSIDLLTASEEQAKHMGARFRERPEDLYNGLLSILLK